MIITLKSNQELHSPCEYLVYKGGDYDVHALVPVYKRDDTEKVPCVAYPAGYVAYGGDYFNGTFQVIESEYTPSQIIGTELLNDPLELNYAGMTDQEKTDSLNAKTRPWVGGERFITARTLLAELDPIQAATIYGKFAAAAPQNPVLAIAMDMLKTYSDGGGIDICHPNTQAFIDTLVGVLLTQEEIDGLKSLAKTSRAKELIGREVTLEEIIAWQ